MANGVIACVIVFCSFLFASQILLEYYVHISDIASDGYLKKMVPKFIGTNKVYSEEIQ